MFSKNPKLDKQARSVEDALIKFHQRDQKKNNPYEGMCYCASVCMKKLAGRDVILWKTRDHNNQFHWWCETKDGEVIDLTKQQYELNNISVPSSGQAASLKEQGRRMSFASYKKKEERMMEIIEELKKGQSS